MTKPIQRPTQLATHDAALPLLLEDLLADVPSLPPSTSEVTPSCVTDSARPTSVDPQHPAPVQAPVVDETSPATPVWTALRMRVLAFRVGEYRFALPLLSLHSVARIDQMPTALPGRPSWHLGVLHYRGQTVVVADLALLLGLSAQVGDRPLLLVLGEGRVAIRCDAVENAVDLDRDDVKWRRSPAAADGLAGIIVETLCVLLDAQVLEQRIRHG